MDRQRQGLQTGVGSSELQGDSRGMAEGESGAPAPTQPHGPELDQAEEQSVLPSEQMEQGWMAEAMTPEKRERIRKTLQEARKVTDGDPVSRWLRQRVPGISPFAFPDIRFHPNLYHGVARTYHPAMVAIVRGADGSGVTVHRTYLAENADGSVRKAFVEPTRMVMPGGKLAGAAIRLLPPVGGKIAVAEGIETALSASILHCFPVWSCVSAGGIGSFVPPEGIEVTAIFADNDKSGAGMIGAISLAARTGAHIQMPDQEGQDWNDVLLQETTV